MLKESSSDALDLEESSNSKHSEERWVVAENFKLGGLLRIVGIAATSDSSSSMVHH